MILVKILSAASKENEFLNKNNKANKFFVSKFYKSVSSSLDRFSLLLSVHYMQEA